MRAAGIARQLGATRQGNNWRCACPADAATACRFATAQTAVCSAFCFGGCEFDEIMPALVEYGLLDDDDDAAMIPMCRDVSLSVSATIATANRARPSRSTTAERWDARIAVYLRSRGIRLTSPVLQFHEQAPHRLGARLPAMLAPSST